MIFCTFYKTYTIFDRFLPPFLKLDADAPKCVRKLHSNFLILSNSSITVKLLSSESIGLVVMDKDFLSLLWTSDIDYFWFSFKKGDWVDQKEHCERRKVWKFIHISGALKILIFFTGVRFREIYFKGNIHFVPKNVSIL